MIWQSQVKAKTLMIQGTSSDAGKSLLVAALCRVFVNMGYKTAPFKSQNMALNSFATEEGHEIGRAQALQAAAAKIKPTVDMNPILLKPTDNKRSQVIVKGRVCKNLTAREYYQKKNTLLKIVEESLNRLRSKYDLVLIEGAGSPAEINLKQEDIANMRIAKIADAPVVLVGDIDRGGVFASIVGTLELLDNGERERVKGIIINKFRGDVSLLKPGLNFLEERTGVKVLGVVPYIEDLRVDSEDSLALEKFGRAVPGNSDAAANGLPKENLLDIVVIRLPHISNFTDIDSFMYEPGVNLRYVSPGTSIGETDLIIIPGTKNTMGDMEALHRKEMSSEIRDASKKGIPVIGICGGYQMLGMSIKDEHGMESDRKFIDGLGLLNCTTSISPEKVTTQVEAKIAGGGDILGPAIGCKVTGYEIHMGETELHGDAAEAFRIKKRGRLYQDVSDGCVSPDGLVFGTYIHGLFDNGILRKSVLDFLKERKGLKRDSLGVDHDTYRQSQLDYLAQKVSENIDVDYLLEAIIKV